MEYPDLIDTKYSLLCTRKLTGEITPVEERELEIWLAASDNNRSMLEGMNRVWQNSEPPATVHSVDIDAEWAILEKRLGLDATAVEKQVKRNTGPFRIRTFAFSRFKPAFALAMATVIVVTGLLIWRNMADAPRLQEILTSNAQTRVILLSDGSKVTINSGSSVRYQQPFSKEIRIVYLEGEAYFDVVADSRPFQVLTDNAKTSVLGTAFNVRCRNGKTSVSVVSGRVKMESIGAGHGEVILAENQSSSIEGDMEPTDPVVSEHGTGWLNGVLQFRMTPLNEICEELERSYDVSINIENEKLVHRTITADFPPLTIDKVLNSLCITLGASYRLEDDVYVIR